VIAEGAGLTTFSASNNVCSTPPVGAGWYDEIGCPTITAVSPSAGPIGGGTTITITGTGFVNDGQGGIKPTVSFGGVTATNVNVVSDTTITATLPSVSQGEATSVVVSMPGTPGEDIAPGEPYILPSSVSAAFAYGPPPTVTSVSPNSGAPGAALVIKGTNFSPGAVTVWFQSGSTSVKATSDVLNSLTAEALVPSGLANGVYDVTVTNRYGSSQHVAADHFTVN
jgi:hypothetical protein